VAAAIVQDYFCKNAFNASNLAHPANSSNSFNFCNSSSTASLSQPATDVRNKSSREALWQSIDNQDPRISMTQLIVSKKQHEVVLLDQNQKQLFNYSSQLQRVICTSEDDMSDNCENDVNRGNMKSKSHKTIHIDIPQATSQNCSMQEKRKSTQSVSTM
jgi:hypothetical protein